MTVIVKSPPLSAHLDAIALGIGLLIEEISGLHVSIWQVLCAPPNLVG